MSGQTEQAQEAKKEYKPLTLWECRMNRIVRHGRPVYEQWIAMGRPKREK